MSASGTSLRVTGRDVLRHPGHALATLLLILIPVAFISFILIQESSRATAFNLSSAQTTVRYVGGQCQQSPDGYIHECTEDTEDTVDRPQEPLLLDALPPGTITRLVVSGPATLESSAASTPAFLLQVDGDVNQAPGPGEIRLAPSQRMQLGVSIGDTLTLTVGRVAVTVTVAEDTPGLEALVTHPTVTDPATFVASRSMEGIWHIVNTTLTWDDVERLNEAGFVVQSDEIAGTPPAVVPGFEPHPMGPQHEPFFFIIVLVTLIFGSVITLLLMLLIAPVFAIAVSRQRRTFALMSAQGATPRQILGTAMLYGIFVGPVGATIGLLLGVIASYVWWPSRYPDWPVVLPVWGLPALWLFAVAVTVAAGFLPARNAARASPLSGLDGGEPGRGIRWRRRMWAGPVLVAVAAVVLLVGWLAPPLPNFEDFNWGSTASAVGGLIGFLGVALSAPAVIWLLARLLRRPLAARLATRDMLHQSLRYSSALAAIAALVTLSTFIMVQSEAYSARTNEWERQAYHPGVIAVQDSPRLEETIAAVSDLVGPLTREDVYGVGFNWLTPTYSYLAADPEIVEPCIPGEPCGPMAWVSGPQTLFDAQIVIASPVLIDALVVPGRFPSGPAMFVSSNTEKEESTFQLRDYDDEPVGPAVRLRLVATLPESIGDWMPTPEAFEQFDLTPEHLGAILIAEQPITPSLRDDLTTIDNNIRVPRVAMKQDPIPRFFVTGIVVAIAALVLALSARQQRRRNHLLLTIGSPPHLARDITAWTGALLTLAGSAMGLLAGHAGALLTSSATAAYTRVDWWLALSLLVIAPVAAAVIGWAVTPRTTD